MSEFERPYLHEDLMEIMKKEKGVLMETIHKAMNDFQRKTGFFVKGEFKFTTNWVNTKVENKTSVTATLLFVPDKQLIL